MSITELKSFVISASSPELSRVQAAFGMLPRNVFVIADNAPIVADALGLPLETVVDIFRTPNPSLYPDVPLFLQRLSAEDSVPVIWTQGHLEDQVDLDAVPTERDLCFQTLKVVRSGLHTKLKPYRRKYTQMGISALFGGFDKCDPTIVLPVLEAVRQNGIERVVAVDDLGVNLLQMGELCNMIHMPYSPVLIDRRKNRQTGAVGSFDDLTIEQNSLYLLDLDRTQIDTDGMKQELYARLARCMQQ